MLYDCAYLNRLLRVGMLSESNIFQQLFELISHNKMLIISYVSNIVIALLIIIIGLKLASFIANFTGKTLSRKGVDNTISDFIVVLLRYALISIVVISALAKVGVQTASLIAILSAASLAIGLALKGSLSNFAAGILLIILRPFKAGNYIEAAGTAGTVQSIQFFQCILKTGDNKHIVVPNSAILNGNIVNYSRKPQRRIDLVIRVSYQTDLKQVKQLLEKVVTSNELVLKQPELQIAVSELANSSVNLVVRPWVKSADFWSVKFALTEAIKNALDDADIKIPYPQIRVHRK